MKHLCDASVISILRPPFPHRKAGSAIRKPSFDVGHLCSSLLLCGIAFFWVPAANAQDVSIRRVTDRVITLSMSNLGMHTNITVIETQKGLVCIETEFVPSVMKAVKKAP